MPPMGSGENDRCRVAGLSSYFVTRSGRLFSERSGSAVELRGGIDHDGYRRYVLIDDSGARRYVRRATLVCEAFHGHRPEGMVVRHLDGSRDNDAAMNLCWSTQAENIADKREHGTMPMGEHHYAAKLNPQSVAAIRASRLSYSVLAGHYGVSKSTIGDVKSGRTWR